MFEIKVLRRIFDLRGRKKTEGGENYIMRSICTLNPLLLG
jgi:hypothetical protein